MTITYAEIATKYSRSLSTVKQTWAKHPDWPAPVGRRGHALEFDTDDVHAVVVRHFLPPPPPDGDPDELLTLTEIRDRTGTTIDTLKGHAYRRDPKVWPPRAGTRGGVSLWRWGDIAAHLNARRRTPPKR